MRAFIDMAVSKYLPVIGLIIFIYFIGNVDLAKVFGNFSRVNVQFLLLAWCVLLLTLLLKGLKWKVIIHSYNLNFSLMKAIKAWLIGYSISLVTPGKVGDLTRFLYLENEKAGKSLTTVIADRVIDVLVLLVLSILGLTLFTAQYVRNSFLLNVSYLVFIVFIGFVFLFSKKKFSKIIVKPFVRFLPKGYRGKIVSVYQDFYEGVEIILKNKKNLAISVMLGFVTWIISIFFVYLLSLSLNLDVPFYFFFMVLPVVSLILALPISFSGIGTREASLIFFLSYAGVGPESAISLSLLILFVEYILGLFGFGFWYRNPIKLRK